MSFFRTSANAGDPAPCRKARAHRLHQLQQQQQLLKDRVGGDAIGDQSAQPEDRP